MQEEFTTAMHEELLGSEMSHEEMTYFGCLGAIRRGVDKMEALKKYGLTLDKYQKLEKKYLVKP